MGLSFLPRTDLEELKEATENASWTLAGV